ncbi:MAG TPA: membrane dipeptidase [Hyphomicrobiaceae bacterium]|nr:membrane dipeptidase [Hyphomicrobiaceae bacterium]
MDRRQLLKGALASPFSFSGTVFAKDPVFIADMHYHLLFIGPNTPASKPLAKSMAAGNATLVAWSLVGDLLWMQRTLRGFKQKGEPQSGAAVTWFKDELARIKAHIAEQNLKIVRTPADVDLALKGEPHVVLSVEGATFLDNDLAQLQAAYDLGVRHIQLVHYIRNAIGDFQTERPRHNGLTAFGKQAVEECNRLGVLVDLAHATSDMVMQTLAVSKAPVVWSHSSVTRTGKPAYMLPVTQARQLGLDTAKAIAAKGGVVGLWAIRSDAGQTVEAYADRLSEMADWLGEDHVAFGTDMNGISNPVITGYADLRRVVEYWERRKMDERRIRKLAIENYARVLKQALAARQA